MTKELTSSSKPVPKKNSKSLNTHEVARFYSSENHQPPENLTWHSQYEVLWHCPNGEPHQFKRKVAKMIVSSLCPYCTGKRLLVGFNDLATTDPELASQWNSQNKLPASAVMRGSAEKFLWSGLCGHTWLSSPKQRTTQGQNCPYCAGIRALAGFNDFQLKHPDQVKFWHPLNEIKPHELMEKSNKIVSWLCSEGHESSMSPKSWLYSGCKICSGRKLLVGYNDLATVAPQLVEEWDYERNIPAPIDFRFNERNYKAHWRCKKCNNRWQAIVRSRVGGSGCPSCAITVSNLEKTVLEALKSYYNGEVLSRARVLKQSSGNPLELDIYLPELRVAFEVQDFATHSRSSDSEHMRYRNHRNEERFKKGPRYHEFKRVLALEQLSVNVVELWEDEIISGAFEETLKKTVAL